MNEDKEHAKIDWNDPHKYITNIYARCFLTLKNTNTCLYLQLTTRTSMLREPKIPHCEEDKSENCIYKKSKTMIR